MADMMTPLPMSSCLECSLVTNAILTCAAAVRNNVFLCTVMFIIWYVGEALYMKLNGKLPGTFSFALLKVSMQNSNGA